MSARVCRNCGHPLSATARYCANCGTPTAWSETPAIAFEEASAPQPEGTERVPWRAMEAIGVFLVALIVTFIVSIPFAIILSPVTHCSQYTGHERALCQHNFNLLSALGVLIQEAATFGTVLVWVRLRRARPSALGLRRVTPANVGIGVAIGAAGLFLAGIITEIIVAIVKGTTHKPVVQPKQIPLSSQSPSVLVLVILGIAVIVMAPLAEEVFFRGFLLRGLRRWASPALAIVLTSVFFGLAHIVSASAVYLIVPPIFGLGILLASVVEARGSLVPSIVAHAAFNAFGFVVQFVVGRAHL